MDGPHRHTDRQVLEGGIAQSGWMFRLILLGGCRASILWLAAMHASIANARMSNLMTSPMQTRKKCDWERAKTTKNCLRSVPPCLTMAPVTSFLRVDPLRYAATRRPRSPLIQQEGDIIQDTPISLDSSSSSSSSSTDPGKPTESSLLIDENAPAVQGKAGLGGAIFNLSNTVIGGGALSLPYVYGNP